MKEIEVKVLNVDKKKIVQKLKSLGAKKIFSGNIETTVYDYPDLMLKKEHSYVRIRKEGNKNILGFKRKIKSENIKIMDEIEVETEDFDKTEQILYGIGLLKIMDAKKYRESYKLKNARFDFDKIPQIPEYMEIEAKSKKDIMKYATILGIQKEECLPWGVHQVMKYYSDIKNKNK